MLKDVKIKKWSAMRGLDRTEAPMAFRFSPVERRAIEVEASANLVRPSDIVRGSLIYAGVIPDVQQENADTKPEPQPAETSEGVRK